MTRRLTPEGAARRARVVELRRQRWTWDAIGADIGVSPQRAHQLYGSAIVDYPRAALDLHRAEELDLIDTAAQRLLAIATDPDDETVTVRDRLKALEVLRGWSARKAALLGLDASKRVSLSLDELDDEVRRLEAELRQEGPP